MCLLFFWCVRRYIVCGGYMCVIYGKSAQLGYIFDLVDHVSGYRGFSVRWVPGVHVCPLCGWYRPMLSTNMGSRYDLEIVYIFQSGQVHILTHVCNSNDVCRGFRVRRPHHTYQKLGINIIGHTITNNNNAFKQNPLQTTLFNENSRPILFSKTFAF